MIQIPNFQTASADFAQSIELAGYLVSIRLRWNVRASVWYLDMGVPELDKEIHGVKVIESWPVLRAHRALLEPFAGDLILIKADSTKTDSPSFDNLGRDWVLWGMTAADVATWEALNGL